MTAKKQYEELVKEIHLATDGDGVASDEASAGLPGMLAKRAELEQTLNIDTERAKVIWDSVVGYG